MVLDAKSPSAVPRSQWTWSRSPNVVLTGCMPLLHTALAALVNLMQVSSYSCSHSLIRIQSRLDILVYCNSRDSGILTSTPNKASYKQVGLIRYVEFAQSDPPSRRQRRAQSIVSCSETSPHCQVHSSPEEPLSFLTEIAKTRIVSFCSLLGFDVGSRGLDLR